MGSLTELVEIVSVTELVERDSVSSICDKQCNPDSVYDGNVIQILSMIAM